MSIKDLFDKGHSLKFVKNKTRDSLSEEVESFRYIEAYSEKRDRFIPDVDLSNPENFARFGLAEEYYDAAIKRIYQTYPYDGSQAEKIEWENKSNYLDLFIFENEYPRTNGFVTFNSSSHTYLAGNTNAVYTSSAPEYITFFGGPHADPGGDYKNDFSAGPSKKGISKANIYHTASQRANNLEVDLDKGLTVEFWMKKDGWAHTSANKDEYIFHNCAVSSSGADYGSLRIRTRGETSQDHQMVVIIESGSTGMTFYHDTGFSDNSAGLADSKWHHYAVTLKTFGSDTVSNLYVDGEHRSRLREASTTINPITGTMKGALGALAHSLSASSGPFAASGWGNIVKASLDEFRYWKTARTAQQIGRFFRDQVGGGTNTDNIKYDDITNKVDLGVYYKFNEGITGISGLDSTILDYSGRISNGNFINYNSSESRNTDSAIVRSGAATKEFKDPIIYASHPEVVTLASGKKISGSAHDHQNASSIYKSMPAWILEEDEEESKNLKYLSQVIASYFDDLYLQTEKLPRLKDINYADDTNYEKPLPFAERLLSSRGYEPPELFAGVSDLAKYLERDEKILFEKKLYEIKNTIYQNIYNNLSYIQKSKGTYKSLRNFLRCFGVGEELVKLNIYSNNDVYEFKDNVTHGSVQKKYIDFDDLQTRYTSSVNYKDAYSATAYQYYDSKDSNSISYIPPSSANLLTGAMMTIEAEVIFPKRGISRDIAYDIFPSSTSSIFGLHAAKESNTDLTFNSSDTINFNIVAIKTDNDLRNVKFALRTSGSSPIMADLTSDDSYVGVYDNEKWNFAFRLRPSKTKTDTGVTLNSEAGFLEPAASAYTYELYGVNYISNALQNEFTLSGTMSLANANTFFTKPKRVFIGAARENFTGSVEQHSDVKISSTRVWLDYLPDETIRAHARDASSYGASQPYRNTNDSLNSYYVPQISTLVMNWTMDNVTGSDANGRFLIEDFASGSTRDGLKFGDSWSKEISRYNYSGRGDKFITDMTYSDHVVDVEFVHSAKLKLPEVVNSDDMVKILNKQDDVVFTRDTTYIQHLLSVEKSMYQTVSEEMLRLFASVANFNNLVGEPVNRYRQSYKKLEKLRELFFESVESEQLDLEKYIEYFKWIDDAVTIMISQLIPVSSNSTEMLRNMVESHVLERNKYWNKFPTLELKPPKPVASLKSIEELKYNWKFGHAPLNPNQNTNQDVSCLWWNQRAERDDAVSSSVAEVNSNKNSLLKISITEISGTEPTLKTSAGSRYVGTYYNNRSLSRPYDIVTDRSLKLKGGSNPKSNKIHDFYRSSIKWGSDDDFIFLDVDNEVSSKVCNDKVIPDELNKKYFVFKALTMEANQTLLSNASASGTDDKRYTDGKSSLLLPFSVYSSSISTGYQSLYSDQFKIDFANLHDDKYGPDGEIPLQGPFAEKYVGGFQFRHVPLNKGSDTELTRAEGWHLKEHLNIAASDEEVIMFERFLNATTDLSTDPRILAPSLAGSDPDDPSDYEYWLNGYGGQGNAPGLHQLNPWTFLRGPGPSVPNTGPSRAGSDTTLGYALARVTATTSGQKFALVSPLIDLLDMSEDSVLHMEFKYHMYGAHIGFLKVQASLDPEFNTDITDLTVRWYDSHETSSTFADSTIIAGSRQTSSSERFRIAYAGANLHTNSLNDYLGKRFYIRFLYTAGATQLGHCAIDDIKITKNFDETEPGTKQNSFKLLSPTHDSQHRPRGVYTRDTIAKRPVNIRNIHMTGNTATIAGNFLDRYEYVNTTSPEANDPFFVKNNDQITRTTAETLVTGSAIATRLSGAVGINYTLPDRSYLTGTIRNRTRFKSRFSSPGGYEVMSRGFLDPAHEIYSVYNAMTYRNLRVRQVYNSQLQAHCGQFGVSAHDSSTARVYGEETVGSIRSDSYELVGQAAAHKYHRNNLERLELSGTADASIPGMSVVTASTFDNAFVSHMIPRTDNQTRWITASLI